MSPLEVAAVVTSVLAIWLTARRQMLCWPINLVACALYFRLFLDVRLYADMVLQGMFGIGVLYGWINWARGPQEAGTVVVSPLRAAPAMVGLASAVVGAVATGWYTSHYTDAVLPWLDATLSSFSLVAQFWTARRHRESWLLWIAVDAVYVGLFVVKGLVLTASLYAILIVLAVAGYVNWRSTEP